MNPWEAEGGGGSLFSLQSWLPHSALSHALLVELLGKNVCTFNYLALKKTLFVIKSLKHWKLQA